MRILLLLRGSASCGKSTWIRQHGLQPYTLSADDIRLLCQSPVMLTDGTYGISQANDGVVWKTLFGILEIRMQRGDFTVIDATNSKTSEMNRYKEMCAGTRPGSPSRRCRRRSSIICIPVSGRRKFPRALR